MIFTPIGVCGAQVEESGIWGLVGVVGGIVGAVSFCDPGQPPDSTPANAAARFLPKNVNRRKLLR